MLAGAWSPRRSSPVPWASVIALQIAGKNLLYVGLGGVRIGAPKPEVDGSPACVPPQRRPRHRAAPSE